MLAPAARTGQRPARVLSAAPTPALAARIEPRDRDFSLALPAIAVAVNCRRGGHLRRIVRRATVVSPFNEAEAKEKEAEKPRESEKKEKPKLSLTWDNVQEVLDELRPYLKSDGGDCKISDIQDSVVKLELIGACSSCSASSVTMKMGIEKTLKERIPEISEVVAIDQEQEPLTESGIEEVLNGIRPFLSVSGGSIEIFELVDGEDAKVVLKMVGPPLKSMAVRVEVQNRIKRKYPAVQNVGIVGEDGQPPQSA
ncbi:NIFU2 [Symbiodinium necroappetens]|uniref:NIFU2 protein n=1 Tax=Symbiodinium necroappetens TaxID=1628268 RepID=A0A812LC50_9DINO|nr:NIFU2 [Symbiodinium necroappetens]